MRKVFIALLATAALLSCSKRESTPVVNENDDIVRFSTNLQTFTVKGETALDGKTVRIFAGAPINATTVATAADNKLSPETPIRWVRNQVGNTTFASVYPAEVSEAPTFEYDLLFEGTHNFDYHVDVLTATAPDVQPGTTVHFTYKHPFALLQIKVKSEKELPEGTVPTVELSEVVAKANFDLAAGTVQLADETAAIPAVLKDDVYQLLIMPQTATPLLTVKVGDKTYKFAVKEALEFQANKRYSSEITLKDAPEVDMDYDVDDWDDEEDPVNFDEVTEEWKVLGLGNDWTWANGVPMTQKEGVWEADITYAEGDSFKLTDGKVWAGMKANWAYYGLGDFEDGYLDATDAGINIVLQAAGKYHLAFTYPSCKLVITAVETPEPQPETVVWKVLGLGNKWDWADGIAMTCTTAGENPGEGVWEADITYAAGDKFKLCNGNTDTAIWAGMKSFWQYYGTGDFEDGYLDPTSAGIDIVLEGAGEYHLTFTYPSCKFVITGDAEPQPEPETVLTFYIQSEWENVYLYVWQSENQLLGGWPGTQVTATETVGEIVYKKYEFKNLAIPTTFNYIVNNGNSGANNQTADLSYALSEKGAKVYIKVNADGSIAQ